MVHFTGNRNEAMLLYDTVYNCLRKADELKLASIAIPAISAGLFRVPADISCKQIVEAVRLVNIHVHVHAVIASFFKKLFIFVLSEYFENVRRSQIRQVYLVDVNQGIVRVFVEEQAGTTAIAAQVTPCAAQHARNIFDE